MDTFDSESTLEAVVSSVETMNQTGAGFHLTLNLPNNTAVDVQGKLYTGDTAKVYQYMFTSGECVAMRCELNKAIARVWPWFEVAFTEEQMLALLQQDLGTPLNYALVDENRLYVQGRFGLLAFIWHPVNVE